jgi:hypothetical protein
MAISIMFVRVLSTAASLVVGAVAVAAIDCSSPSLQLISGDPIGICTAADTLGGGRGLWVGIGLAVFSAIALLAAWLRPAEDRLRFEPESSLNRNLGRLVESPSDPVDPGPAPEVHVRRVTKRLEAIEEGLAADTTPTRELTEQWMALLRDLNALHNSDDLSTGDFKTLNTRLVELFAGPVDKSEELAASQ